MKNVTIQYFPPANVLCLIPKTRPTALHVTIAKHKLQILLKEATVEIKSMETGKEKTIKALYPTIEIHGGRVLKIRGVKAPNYKKLPLDIIFGEFS